MPPKREAPKAEPPKAEGKAEANEKKKINVEGQTAGQASGLSAIESIYHDRLPQGRALNRWDAEAERDLIMACLTSENNNYPTINWPRVKLIMDDRGYKFSRSALDQRWSKTIMKEWRERRGPGTLTDFVDPDTANNTPARKRGRILAVAKAKQNERIAAALAARNLANSTAENTQVSNTQAESSLADNGLAGNTGAVRRRVDSAHLTRSLETRVFGTAAADADDAEVVGGDTKYLLMQPPPAPATAVDQGPASDETSNKPSPSPGDLLFLQQCDKFRIEEGNEVAEEPPRKRRAPRRSKAEMDKVRADKEAARVKREEERARKQAALNAKASTPKVAVKKEKNVVNLITPPRPPPAVSAGVVEIEDDFDPNLLYQMPRSVNNPQTMATPTFGARGSTVAPPSGRSTATPAPDTYGFSQGFNAAMNYPTPSTSYSAPSGNYTTTARNGSTPSRNVPLPSFQANFGMEPAASQRNFAYPMRQNTSFNSNSYSYGMMGQYNQPMSFNFGMPQSGYQSGYMQNYSMNQDPMFNLPPSYGNTGQTGSDARVLLGDSPADQPTTEPQAAAPMAPMDIIPTIETDNDHAGPSTDKAT